MENQLVQAFKIIGLKVSGIRKLSAIEMDFEENGLIPIVGRNKEGKTSILDSIEVLFKGIKSASNGMITHGKSKAQLEADIGTFKIKRVITDKSNRLEVKAANGGYVLSKPQEFLDTLFNELTFNPGPFIRKPQKEKLKFIMKLFKIDLTEYEKEINDAMVERTVVGRELKRFGDIGEVKKPCGLSFNREDVEREMDDIQAHNVKIRDEAVKRQKDRMMRIVTFNNAQEKKQEVIDRETDNVNKLSDKLFQIENTIKGLKDGCEKVEKAIKAQKDYVLTLEQPKPLKALDVEMEKMELRNLAELKEKLSLIDAWEAEQKIYEDFVNKRRRRDITEKEYSVLSEKISSLRGKKLAMLANIKMPVKGLEVREDGLYLDGVSSDNWSESENLRISSELCAAMNPALRAIRIDRGESYDKKSLLALKEWAIKNDIQAFITIVDDVPEEEMEEGVFYIENGMIKK